jgi:hypothetical protein
MSQPWPRDSNETASDQAGAVQIACGPHSKDPDVQKFDFLDKRSPNHVADFALPGYADQIKADALSPESHKADVPAGEIKEIVKRDEGGRKVHEFVSSDGKTTFIPQMMRPRLIISKMLGVDRIGGPPRPVEKPHNMGRMGRLPRSA